MSIHIDRNTQLALPALLAVGLLRHTAALYQLPNGFYGIAGICTMCPATGWASGWEGTDDDALPRAWRVAGCVARQRG